MQSVSELDIKSIQMYSECNISEVKYMFINENTFWTLTYQPVCAKLHFTHIVMYLVIPYMLKHQALIIVHSSFNPHTTLKDRYWYYPHFTDEDTGWRTINWFAQSHTVCRKHSWDQVQVAWLWNPYRSPLLCPRVTWSQSMPFSPTVLTLFCTIPYTPKATCHVRTDSR